MFALVETVAMPRETIWKRLTSAFSRTDACRLTEDAGLCPGAMRLKIPLAARQSPGRGLRRVRGCLESAYRAGLRLAVPALDFKFCAELGRAGLARVQTDPLLRRIGGKIFGYAVSAMKREPRDLTVAVMREHADDCLLELIYSLCPQVKNLAVCCGQDSSAICWKLRRDFGIPALDNPSKRILSDCDIFMVFGKYGGLDNIFCKERSLAIMLDTRDCPPPRGCVHVDGVLPRLASRSLDAWDNFGRLELICALENAFSVQIEDIVIEALTLDGERVL